MIGKKPLNIGNFEVLPNLKEYSTYLEFLNDYSSNKPNKDGVIIADYRKVKYLMQEFKKLGIYRVLEKYYMYTLVSEITVRCDFTGTNGYRDYIIDDPEEIINFQNGEPAIGYNSDGDEDEMIKGSDNVDNWEESKSVFFLIRNL